MLKSLTTREAGREAVISCGTTSVGDIPCPSVTYGRMEGFPTPDYNTRRRWNLSHLRWLRLHEALHSTADICRALHHFHARCRQRSHLLRRGALAARDDRAGMSHAPAWRSGLTGNEAHHRLLERLLNIRRRLFLGRSADLADHRHGIGFGIVRKELQHVDKRRTDERIAANADARRLPHAQLRELMNRLIGERAALRDDADAAFAADLPGDDAGLGLAWGDGAWTIRPYEARAGSILQKGQRAHHVERGNAFGDAHNQPQPRVGRF